jgi:hypothetical protein
MATDRPRVALLAAPRRRRRSCTAVRRPALGRRRLSRHDDRRTGEALLDVSIVAARREPFRCFGNILDRPHLAIDELDSADVIVVCDLYTPIDTLPRGRYEAEIDWVRRLHGNGTLVASVCTGSLLSRRPASSTVARAPATGPTSTCSGPRTPDVDFDPPSSSISPARPTASSPRAG